MGTSEGEILKKLLANYDNATKLMPENLKKEFRERILRREELEAYAPLVSRAIEYQSDLVKTFLQNVTSARFSIDRFGRRLILSGINPEQVYAELLRGIFDG